MHEFSIASEIFDTAAEACDSDYRCLRGMTIHVGQLSSVVITSLNMCMEAVLEDHNLEGVDVEIVKIPARAVCECGHEYEPETLFGECPECGSIQRDIIAGRNVILDSIEVDDGEDQSQ